MAFRILAFTTALAALGAGAVAQALPASDVTGMDLYNHFRG